MWISYKCEPVGKVFPCPLNVVYMDADGQSIRISVSTGQFSPFHCVAPSEP